MLAQFSIADYVVFALTLALSAAIGVFYGCTGGKQSTVAEFLMADRKMQLFPVAMSMLASFTSAISILGTPAETYFYGTMYAWLILGFMGANIISSYVYIPVFYNLHVTSAYEYLEKRFSRGVRIYGAIAYIVQTVLYMAMVLYAPALALAQVTGFEVWIAVLSSGIVCTFYTALGGMKAVMWTDTLQAIIMYAGILAGIIQGCIDQGGASGIWEDAVNTGRMNFYNVTQAFDPNPLERHSFWTLAIGGIFTWTAVYGVNQAQVQRALSVPTLKVAKTAYLLNTVGQAAFLLLGTFCGLIIYSRYKECDPLSASLVGASDQLYPFFIMDVLGRLQGLPGLFTAAIYSGTLSTISSGLNSMAAVTLEDLVRTRIKPDMTDRQATFISKMLAMGYGVVIIALAFVAGQLVGIMQATLALFGVLGGPILGVFTLGMFFPSANTYGAYAGISIAFVFTLWIGIGQQVYRPKLHKLPLSTDNCTGLYNLTGILPVPGNNATISGATNVTTISATSMTGSLEIYRLSYMWLSALGCLCTVVIGLIASATAEKLRKSSAKKSATNLFTPAVLAIYRRLPVKEKSFVDFYVSVNESEKVDNGDVEGKKIKLADCDEHLEENPSRVRLLSQMEDATNC